MMLSYRSKLLLNFTLLFAAFTLLLVGFQYNRERQYRRELLEARLLSYADLVAGDIETNGLNSTTAVEELKKVKLLLPKELRLTVIGKNGTVIYESDGMMPHEMGNHHDRPEVRLALNENEGSDIRASVTEGKEFFYFAKAYGSLIVRVALPYDNEVRNFMKADNVFLWFALMLFPIVLVLLIYISDHFGKAIAQLRLFISSADRGLVDYDQLKFPHSELGDVAATLTLKYRQLDESNRQIALERERLLRHFLYSEAGIAIFSPDRQKIFANPKFTQYANTILDRPTADLNALWSNDRFQPVCEFLEQNVNGGSPVQEAPLFRYTIQAGSSCFAVQVLIYSDQSFELSLTDITQAEQTKKLKQQMSNNITHELRTPVSSIRGYLETIMECAGLNEQRKDDFLRKAHAQAVRLTDLIRDVALITKAEEAPEALPLETIDVSRMVEDIADELRGGMEQAGMEFQQLIQPGTTLTGNYSLVYAIFRNLMENSIRYAGQGTKMCAELYNEDKDFLYFSFRDTGCGVPEEHLPRLFERFYRVTEGRTRDCGGTGLGLSIVRNAVLCHSGEISVRNRKEGGLEILFCLKKNHKGGLRN